MPTHAAWRLRAACPKTGPEPFFPMTERGELSPARLAPALALCAGCEARGPCLAAAVEAGETMRIWGGVYMSARRLRELRQGSGAS